MYEKVEILILPYLAFSIKSSLFYNAYISFPDYVNKNYHYIAIFFLQQMLQALKSFVLSGFLNHACFH